MGKVEQSIDVNVPLSTAYNQWTQFEEFPRFMEGVKRVRQLDDRTLEWTAEIGGNEESWTAEISEQEPDKRVAWHATSGATNAGVVTFHRIDDDTTRVMLQMEWQPQNAAQSVGDALGLDDRRVKGDLERFKEFIESRGAETGAWRGEVKQESGGR
ncbi:SRPBCC family protein [soil metagenome]